MIIKDYAEHCHMKSQKDIAFDTNIFNISCGNNYKKTVGLFGETSLKGGY